jgi:hypothetical protein
MNIEEQAIAKTKDMFEGIKIEPITLNNINDIATLHYKILSWSLNGSLGKEHILELYKAIFESSHVFGYICYSGDTTLGFLTATTNSSKTRNSLIKIYANKIPQLIKHLLKKPKDIIAILESKFLVPYIFKKYECNAEWLTFVTDTSNAFITPYVSLGLMAELKDHFKKNDIDFYMAQGIKDNPKAIKYYKKLKWKVVQKLLMHNIYYYKVA